MRPARIHGGVAGKTPRNGFGSDSVALLPTFSCILTVEPELVRFHRVCVTPPPLPGCLPAVEPEFGFTVRVWDPSASWLRCLLRPAAKHPRRHILHL